MTATDLEPGFTSADAAGGMPLLGHVWPLMRRPFAFLESLSGQADLVAVRIGPTKAYVPCHPRLLRQVLTDDRTFDKGGPLIERSRELAPNGLATCPHGQHRRLRRLMQPAFRHERISGYAPAMLEEFARLSDSWSDGQDVDVFPVLQNAVLRIVARSLFSTVMRQETIETIVWSIETLTTQIVRRMFLPKALRSLPTKANRDYARARGFLETTVGSLIAEYRAGGEDRGDLMSMLVFTTDEEGDHGGLTDREVYDQVITLFAAGGETGASTIAWALHLLCEHPEIQRAVQAELDRVLAGRPVAAPDLPALELTRRVLMETMRLYPAVWLLTRVTTTPTVLAGRHLPAGTSLVFAAPAVHSNGALYPEPARFDPDRWLKRNVTPPVREGLVPFGAGARKCIGDDFAYAEMTTALACLLQRWTVSSAPGNDPRPTRLATFYHPRGLRLRFGAR